MNLTTIKQDVTTVDKASLVLIVLFMLTDPVTTLDGLPQWAYSALDATHWVITILFLLEYVWRIWTAERKKEYLFSFYGVVDFLAIVPALIFPIMGLQEIRALRLLRLFRVVKVAKYSTATMRLSAALKESRHELVLFTSATAILIYLASFGIYYFEHTAQPDVFRSVFDALWWSVITLTTVGYGDMYPITTGGRIFTSILVFIGLGIVAVPAGIMASALSKVKENPSVTD